MSSFTIDAVTGLAAPDWLARRRVDAFERFSAVALPTEAEEVWRYSRIGRLDLDAYAPSPADAADAGWSLRSGHAGRTLRSGHAGRTLRSGHAGLPEAVAGAAAAAGERAAHVVVRNGRVASIEIDPALAAKGLVVADAADLPDGDDLLGAVAGPAGDAFGELHMAFLSGAVVVRVPRGLEVDRPVLVSSWVDGEGTAAFPHTIVDAADDSGITVIEHQGSADVAAFVAPVVELRVGSAARVRYLNVQDLGPRVWQVGYQASEVERDATLRSAVVALGGSYARVRTDSRIVGQGGTSFLNAAYFADGERMHDFRTLQDHVAPSSTSDLLFKGAVQDHGRSVYSGLIRVRKEARGTNAFQTNRNLVLSEGAGAESVPNLEIETDDVKCSHASAVGPIDDDQRYYLESRGMSPAVAERLIVLGFLAEVLDQLPNPAFVAGVRAAVASRLAARPGADS